MDAYRGLFFESTEEFISAARCVEAVTEQHGINVSTNTVFSFVKVRAKSRKLYALPQRATKESSVSSEVRSKAEAFFKSEPNNDHEPKPKKLYNIGF